MKKFFIFILILFSSFSLLSCKDEKNNNPVHDLYLEALENGYKGSYDEWLLEIKGAPGKDGREIELDVKDNYIVWRYKGDTSWTNLKSLDELIGKDGKSVYELYIESHPEYTKSEEEWLEDLLHGRLVNNEYALESTRVTIDTRGISERPLNYINAYFYKNGHVPYLGVSSFIKAMGTHFKHPAMTRDVNLETHVASYSYTLDDFKYQMDVNWVDDTITVNHTDFFTYLTGKPSADQTAYLKLKSREFKGESKASFNLKENDIDIIFYEDDVLIQADVISYMLLCYDLTNLVYNGDEFVMFAGSPDALTAKRIRSCSKNGNSIPGDLLQATNNGLAFIMDNYYGLGEEMFMDFNSIVGEWESASRNLENPNPNYHNEMYKTVLLTAYDDLHTGLLSKSVYNDYTDNFYERDKEYTDKYGFKTQEYIITNQKLDKLYNEANANESKDEMPLKFVGSTAFITINSFMESYSVLDPSGTLANDAWKHDTFALVKMSLDKIREYNKANNNAITDVCLDLTRNGGGIVDAMLSCIGLMTNKDVICPKTNYNSKADLLETYQVDADLDGDFTDDDAYTEFNYNLLISELSFSCANSMPSIVKDLNIAKLIGETSGGGMCIVSDVALLDGTVYSMSGYSMIRSLELDKNGAFTEIESGVTPNYRIDDQKFYDYDYLNNFIKSGYKEA